MTRTKEDAIKFIEGKLTEAKAALKSREDMARIYRGGTDESWAAAAMMHPSTAGKPFKKAERIEESNRQTRIAARKYLEVEMFEFTLQILNS